MYDSGMRFSPRPAVGGLCGRLERVARGPLAMSTLTQAKPGRPTPRKPSSPSCSTLPPLTLPPFLSKFVVSSPSSARCGVPQKQPSAATSQQRRPLPRYAATPCRVVRRDSTAAKVLCAKTGAKHSATRGNNASFDANFFPCFFLPVSVNFLAEGVLTLSFDPGARTSLSVSQDD